MRDVLSVVSFHIEPCVKVPGGAATPHALPSGPVRTGGEGGGCLHKDPRVSLSMLSLYTLGGPPNLVHLVADTNCAPRWLGSDTASL